MRPLSRPSSSWKRHATWTSIKWRATSVVLLNCWGRFVVVASRVMMKQQVKACTKDLKSAQGVKSAPVVKHPNVGVAKIALNLKRSRLVLSEYASFLSFQNAHALIDLFHCSDIAVRFVNINVTCQHSRTFKTIGSTKNNNMPYMGKAINLLRFLLHKLIPAWFIFAYIK